MQYVAGVKLGAKGLRAMRAGGRRRLPKIPVGSTLTEGM